MTSMVRALLAIILCCAFGTSTLASDPPVPSGSPTTGSVMVAIIGPGLDYRLPEIKDRLARDGEGDLIAWDFSDDDNKPFTEGGVGTEAAKEFVPFNTASIVVAKEKSGDPQAFGQTVSFAAQTPARVILWLTARPDRPDWSIFLAATKHFKNHLFIVPGEPKNASSAVSAAGDMANVLVVDLTDSGQMQYGHPDSLGAMGRVLGHIAASAADAWSRLPTGTAKDIKAAIAKAHGTSPDTTSKK